MPFFDATLYFCYAFDAVAITDAADTLLPFFAHVVLRSVFMKPAMLFLCDAMLTRLFHSLPFSRPPAFARLPLPIAATLFCFMIRRAPSLRHTHQPMPRLAPR